MSTTAARVEELLDRWLASVELHLRYAKLDDAAYARAEAWPKHQRPNAFVVNLARTRLLELKKQLLERRDAGDERFAESLELMSFLTGLLGSEHLERYIPLATGKPPDPGISGTIEQPRMRAAARTPAQHAAKNATGNHRRPTRAPAVPRVATTPRAAVQAAPAQVPAQTTAQTPAQAPAPLPARKATPAAADQRPTAPPPPLPPPVKNEMSQRVIADAVRMLDWGREWPALAGLIARMADRPSEAEVWRILRAHRAEILGKSRRSAG